MNSRYYVPVFANWEGEIVPTKLTNGTVAFYNPSFPPADAQTSPKLNATVPAFWILCSGWGSFCTSRERNKNAALFGLKL